MSDFTPFRQDELLSKLERIAVALERLGSITDEQPKSPQGSDSARWRRTQERGEKP